MSRSQKGGDASLFLQTPRILLGNFFPLLLFRGTRRKNSKQPQTLVRFSSRSVCLYVRVWRVCVSLCECVCERQFSPCVSPLPYAFHHCHITHRHIETLPAGVKIKLLMLRVQRCCINERAQCNQFNTLTLSSTIARVVNRTFKYPKMAFAKNDTFFPRRVFIIFIVICWLFKN